MNSSLQSLFQAIVLLTSLAGAGETGRAVPGCDNRTAAYGS